MVSQHNLNSQIPTLKTVRWLQASCPLFVSHDLRFIENIGQELLIVEDKKIKSFNGRYSEYIKSRSSKIPVGKIDSFKEDRMILEMEISSLISRISMEEDLNEIEKLDEIYKEKLEILQTLKNK